MQFIRGFCGCSQGAKTSQTAQHVELCTMTPQGMGISHNSGFRVASWPPNQTAIARTEVDAVQLARSSHFKNELPNRAVVASITVPSVTVF